MKRIIIFILALMLLSMSACTNSSSKIETIDIDDSDIFYRNKTELFGADPFVLKDKDESGKECFYLYSTSRDLNAKGFEVYKSYNLGDWIKNEAVFMCEGTWCNKNLWAPEVIKDGDTYYLFYSAQWNDDNQGFYISVATSDGPANPFIEYQATKSSQEPLIQFENHVNEIPATYRSNLVGHNGKVGYIKVIDANPFIDPVTGKKYLYFIADLNTDYTPESFVFGMEMEDWLTPKYNTLTRLTEFGKVSPGSDEYTIESGRTNEGCEMYYHNGKYYLAFSTGTYMMAEYQVRQAIGDSPLGPFTKIQYNDGGTIIFTEATSIRQSAGHHCFLEIGDELYIVYHSFFNDRDVDGGRKPAVDKIAWVKNSEGIEVMQVNGPTTTPQPLPEELSGYKNLALNASIDCDNGAGNLSTDLLHDGYIPLHRLTPVNEYILNDGESTITISLNSIKNVKAILVYTSVKDSMRLSQLDSVTLEGEETYTFKDVELDDSKYAKNDKIAYEQPCSLVFAQDQKASTITIKIDADYSIGIPEIIVLGK